MSPLKTISVSRHQEKALEALSPFELKNNLIQLAEASTRSGAAQMLNAGRGNPNWVCTTPREAFFTLGRFGIEESKRSLNLPDTGGMPQKPGSAARFMEFLDRNPAAPGVKLLRAGFDYGVKKLGLDADSLIHELAASIPFQTAC
jgi:aspartate 4-decarboxylase